MQSPYPYMGMGGMDPLMKSLLNHGFTVEWNIIVIGSSSTAASHYRDLCIATGGAFLHLTSRTPTDPTRNRAASKFLESVATAHSKDKRAADEEATAARRAYEKQVASGASRKFDWYAALPPPRPAPRK